MRDLNAITAFSAKKLNSTKQGKLYTAPEKVLQSQIFGCLFFLSVSRTPIFLVQEPWRSNVKQAKLLKTKDFWI